MVDFSNTKVAFVRKSKKELRQSIQMFRVIGKPWVINAGKLLLHFALFIRFPIKWIIKPTIFKHFCGGENIEECQETISGLAYHNIKCILDYAAEGMNSEEDFDRVKDEVISNIKSARNNKNIPFCVFKPTGIANFNVLEKISAQKALSDSEEDMHSNIIYRFDQIFSAAHNYGVNVFVDAEESWIQKAIDDIVLEMMLKYNKERAIVQNTVQLYRTDRLKYLEETIEEAKNKQLFAGFKLVRGAYHEKERKRAIDLHYEIPVHQQKKETDKDYNASIKLCIQELDKVSVCIATHNEESCKLATSIMKSYKINNNDSRVYFSQLFGMSDHISFNLASNNYNVAKYLPYGTVRTVVPYLIRRAEENTSIAGQTSRELTLLTKELKRRKSIKTKPK